jgi:hypothetical protein
MQPIGIPRTLTVHVNSWEIDVLLNEDPHGKRRPRRAPAVRNARPPGPADRRMRHSPIVAAPTPIVGSVLVRGFGQSLDRGLNEAPERTLDDSERELLDVLLNDHPTHLSEQELTVALGNETTAADAIAGLRASGLIHQADDGYWFLAHPAHYLAALETGPALTTVETLLAEPAQLSYKSRRPWPTTRVSSPTRSTTWSATAPSTAAARISSGRRAPAGASTSCSAAAAQQPRTTGRDRFTPRRR